MKKDDLNMKFNHLHVEMNNDIAYVLFNQSKDDNQFNVSLAQELLYIGNYFIESDHLKAIVVGHNGPHFSRGLLNERGDVVVDDDIVNVASEAIDTWSRISFPIIMAINGHCHSVALSFATIADIRLAHDNVQFKVPEVTQGYIPIGGITQRLPRIIGKGPSMPILLSGKTMYAEEALNYGFINRIVYEGTVWEKACKQAEQLAAMSPISMQYTKECILRGGDLPFEQALRLEIDMYMILQSGEDRMEGVNAFLEKRDPIFKGK